MSSKQIGEWKEYIVRSVDTKPDHAAMFAKGIGGRLYETDTGREYIYSALGWVTDARSSMNEKNIHTVTGTKALATDNEIISAPGTGYRTVLTYFQVQNESSTETTVIMKNGSTSMYRALLPSKSAITRDYPLARERKLTENTALNLNLSGANSHGYNVEYYVEAV